MKLCKKCGILRHDDEFHHRTLAHGKIGRRGVCKICKSKVVHRCIEKNRDRYNKNSRNRSKKYQVINKLKIINYLLTHPCIDCGQNNPILLDFDHIDRSTKRKHISAMLGKYSWESISHEISKCVVRCAYCHRIHTAKQLGYLKHVDQKYFEITWRSP